MPQILTSPNSINSIKVRGSPKTPIAQPTRADKLAELKNSPKIRNRPSKVEAEPRGENIDEKIGSKKLVEAECQTDAPEMASEKPSIPSEISICLFVCFLCFVVFFVLKNEVPDFFLTFHFLKIIKKNI